MADNNINASVGAEDKGYDAEILRIIQRNKELETQMLRTKTAIESTNTAFDRARASMTSYNNTARTVFNNSNNSRTSGGNSFNFGSSNNGGNNEGSSGASNKSATTVNDITKVVNQFNKIPGMNTSQVSGLVSTIGELGASAGPAGIAVAAVVAALGLMAVAGNAAYQADLKVYQSLKMLGGASTDVSNTANKVIELKDRWNELGQEIGTIFEPVFNGLINVGTELAKLLGTNSKTASSTGGSSGIIADFANQVLNARGTPVSTSTAAMANTADAAKSLGFTNASAANLATGTYAASIRLQSQYGDNATDINKALGSAINTGSNDASKYGVNVSDQTLEGWLLKTKGIDIVNTKITDAQKEMYRYELAMQEIGSSNSDVMQKSIKDWTTYGGLIESAKNQLFSFDKVITLTAYNPTIPDVGKQNTSIPSTSTTGGTAGVVPGSTPSGTTPATKIPVTAPNAPVVEKQLKDLNNEANKLKVGHTVGLNWGAIPSANRSAQALGQTMLGLEGPYTIGVNTSQLSSAYSMAQQLAQVMQGLGASEGSSVPSTSSSYASLPNLQVGNTVPSSLASGASTTKSTSKPWYSQAASSILSGISSVNSWLLKSGVSAKAQNAYNTLFSKKMQQIYGLTGLSILGLGGAGAIAGTAGVGAGATALGSTTITDISALEQLLSNYVSKHADGGISTNAHIANISEGNKAEAIIPLSSGAATPAYEQIGKAVAQYIGGSTGDVKLEIHLGENGTIIENSAAIKKLSSTIADNIAILNRNRGSLSYGKQ